MNAHRPIHSPAALQGPLPASGETVTAADGLAERSAAEYREAAAAARARHNTAEARALDERASEIEADGLADPDELHEAAREEAIEEFNEWRGLDWRNREHADLGEWLARMSQPHMVDHEKYALAMTWAERGYPRLTDEQLVALSVNQRKFGRENRRAGGRS